MRFAKVTDTSLTLGGNEIAYVIKYYYCYATSALGIIGWVWTT